MAEVTEWQHSTHVKQRSSAALVGKGVAAAMQNVVVVAVMQNKGVAVAVVWNKGVAAVTVRNKGVAAVTVRDEGKEASGPHEPTWPEIVKTLIFSFLLTFPTESQPKCFFF